MLAVKKQIYFVSLAIQFLLICIVLLFQCVVPNARGNVDTGDLNINYKMLSAQEKMNVARANKLLNSLYCKTHESFPQFTQNTATYFELGTQAGYLRKTEVEQAGDFENLATNAQHEAFLNFKRVWVYDAGIALSLAVASGDPTADARARWLLKHGEFIDNPKEPGLQIFAGWPFSMNQEHVGDSWRDCRFVTGANTYGLGGLAHYMTSDFFKQLSEREQLAYLTFFASALEGILYHIESSGPNEGLVAAGWSVNALEDIAQIDYSYNDLLDQFGYGLPKMIDGYSKPIQVVRANHIILEHCIGLLALLNYTLDHFDQLMKKNSSYSHSELNEIRIKLRDSIFVKFYNEEKRHFISWRTAAGEPSPHKAIDNTTWLILALRLDELTGDQLDVLSNSLVYTIENFAKEFVIDDKSYFAAYYFEDGFEDPYIPKSSSYSNALHIEATCGLICSLLKFVREYTNSPHNSLFRVTTLKLWQSMQYLVNEHGFIYSTGTMKNIDVPLEASVSAIWYMRTYHYFNKVSM